MTEGQQLRVIVGMNGLKELYSRFGLGEFSGPELRGVMLSVAGQSGWQASLALGRLVKAGVVDRVITDAAARASWGHTYQITYKGLAHLGVNPEQAEDAESQHWDERYARLATFLSRISGKRIRVSSAFINDPENRETLRLGVAAGWLQLVASVTPEGSQWLASLSEEVTNG